MSPLPCGVPGTRGFRVLGRKRLANGKADEPHERGGVHAERNLVVMAGVDQQSHAGAGLSDGLVHLLRLPVSPTSLNVSTKKMAGYGIEYGLGRLRACSIIKENELGITLQRGKRRANLAYGELWHGPNDK